MRGQQNEAECATPAVSSQEASKCVTNVTKEPAAAKCVSEARMTLLLWHYWGTENVAQFSGAGGDED